MATDFDTNDNQQDSTFGVDSNELVEHHLQAALSSNQLAATSTGTKKSYHIPTPKTVEVLTTKQYNEEYPPNAYSDPVTFVQYSDTVEDNIRGAPYCLDEDDQGWLDKHNDKARKEMEKEEKALKDKEAVRALACEQPERLLVITEDEFETVMSIFERTTSEKQPLLELGFAKAPTLDDLLQEFEESSATSALALPELPPYSADEPNPLLTKPAKKSDSLAKPGVSDMEWSPSNPYRHLPVLKPCARVVYPWWYLRRQARDGKAIVPYLNFDESNESDPYVCFRRREVKVARKTRKTDTLQLEKLVRLQSEMMQATQLFMMVAQREQLKEEQVKKSHECWGQACRLLDIKNQWSISGPLKGQEDENLIFGIQPDPMAPVPNTSASAQNAQLLRKKRKAEETSMSTTVKLRRPRMGDADPLTSDLASDPSGNGIGAGILERVQVIQAYIERETLWRQQNEAGFEDLTDLAYQPPAAPTSQRAFRPIQSDSHDTQFWASHPFARLGRQPCFRRRVGRGGRVFLDRRPLTVSPAPANIAAWPRSGNGWFDAPLDTNVTQLNMNVNGRPTDIQRLSKPLMLATPLKPTLLATPNPPCDVLHRKEAGMGLPREAVQRGEAASGYTNGPFAVGHRDSASTSSDSTERSKSPDEAGDDHSTQATDVEQDMMQEEKWSVQSASDDEGLTPEELSERTQKMAERWRYDEDGGRWAGLGLLGLGGMEGDEEAVLDDYDHRFMRYRMSLLNETNLLKLSTDWTYMRHALAAAEVHPPSPLASSTSGSAKTSASKLEGDAAKAEAKTTSTPTPTQRTE